MSEETDLVWFNFKVSKAEKDKAIAAAKKNNSDLSKELRRTISRLAKKAA